MKHISANQKGFSLLVVFFTVIVVAGLAFGGWYVWKNQKKDTGPNDNSQISKDNGHDQQGEVDPYAGWQTYRNAVYGIEFRYPQNWEVEEVDNRSAPESGNPSVEYAINLKRKEEVKYNNTVAIEILPSSLEEASIWYDRNPEPSASNSVSKTTDSLKGKQSVQYRVTNVDGELRNYLFGVSDKTYVLRSVNEWLNLQSDATYWEKFDGVLETLKIN